MEIRQAIENRRSINYFDTEKRIDENVIDQILNLAALSPSNMNLQPWKVLTVISPEKKELLKKTAFNQPKVTEASVMFVILADKDYAEKNAADIAADMKRLGYIDEKAAEGYPAKASAGQGAPDSAVRERNAIISSSLFAMNLMYACAAHGIETHPMGGFDHEMLRKEFNIPERITPVMFIAAGYLRPGIKLLPRVKRLPADSFNHIL